MIFARGDVLCKLIRANYSKSFSTATPLWLLLLFTEYLKLPSWKKKKKMFYVRDDLANNSSQL